MAKFAIGTYDEASVRHVHPFVATTVGAISARLLSPESFPLWLCDVELDDGATLSWNDEHGDEALYVLDGTLEIDGRRCPNGGGVIVESNVVTQAVAVGRTRLAHFGSRPTSAQHSLADRPSHADGREVHVVGSGGMFQSGQDDGVRAVWFSDGTCATCRCQLFQVTAPERDTEHGKPHNHSTDEIIYVLEGQITLGPYALEPFSALCMPASVRYSLGGSGAHRFVNFRREVSEQVYARGSTPVLETALARGGWATNDVR